MLFAVFTFIDDAGIELHGDGVSDDLGKKAGGVFPLALRTILHGGCCGRER